MMKNIEKQRQDLLGQGYIKVGSKSYVEYWKKGDDIINLNTKDNEDDILIYLLYDGTSEDGRGNGKFYKSTKDKKEALKHYKAVKKDPYSIGSVWVLTSSSLDRIFSDLLEIKYFGKMVK